MAFSKLAALLALAVGANAADDDQIVVGQTFMAGAIDPTSGSTGWALTSHGISEKLFTVDKDGNIVGQVAESVERVSDNVWEVTLKDGYKFSDGTDVTAQAVADALTELNTVDPNGAGMASVGTMTVTAPSDGVVRIETERATHVMDAVLAEWVFTVYKKDGDEFVFTGPYAVDAFVGGGHIDLVPNMYYIDGKAGERPNIKLLQYPDGESLADAVVAGTADVAFHLPIDKLTEVRAADGVHVKTFEVNYHYMMHHNVGNSEGRPINDLKVRQAIDLAIDRTALSQALAGGHGTRSLFPDFTPYYNDDTDGARDRKAAEALLDEAGWVLDEATGVRSKDGQELEVDLVAYAFRPGLGLMQPSLAAALEEVGFKVNVIMTRDGNYDNSGYDDDWTEIMKRRENGDWDLLMWAQNTLPAGDPAQFLNAFFRSGAGSNYAGLASDDVDAKLDALQVTEDHDARVAATADAHAAIITEQAVSNLLTPAWHVGLSDRMEEYEPWGSDYYVIRDDFHTVGTAATDDAAGTDDGTVEPSDDAAATDDGPGPIDDGNPGCYDVSIHQCDCSIASETDCAAPMVWTSGCTSCAGGDDHGDGDHDDHDGHDHGEGDKDESDGATGWTVVSGAAVAALAVLAF